MKWVIGVLLLKSHELLLATLHCKMFLHNYDFLVYIHNYVSRDASKACQVLNRNLKLLTLHSLGQIF